MALTKPVNVIAALRLTEAHRAKDVLIEDAVGFSPARARLAVSSPLLIASGHHFFISSHKLANAGLLLSGII